MENRIKEEDKLIKKEGGKMRKTWEGEDDRTHLNHER